MASLNGPQPTARGRSMWLTDVANHVREARTHHERAALWRRTGFPDREAEALRALAIERQAYTTAIDAHPEWAPEAAAWPERLDT